MPNYRFPTTAEKSQRLQQLHHQHRLTKKKLSRLQEKLCDVIDQLANPVDEDKDGDVRAMMAEEEKSMFDNYPKGSFQRLFWEKQKKAAAKKDLRGIRWHLLMIRFCLYLRHQSGKAYETLRDSGCIRLPSQQTLRDYSHAVKAEPGFSKEVDFQLTVAANVMMCK